MSAGKLADVVTGHQRRILSLERRLRDLRLVRYLHQLLDVEITYEGPEAVADGDVLTFDDEIKMWVAAPGGGGGGGRPTMSIVGEEGGEFDSYEVEWSFSSDTIDLNTSSGGMSGPVGIMPTAPGIYAVHAQILSGTGRVRILTTSVSGGWQHVGETECRSFPVGVDSGSNGGSCSVLMPCVDVDGESVTGAQVVFDGLSGAVTYRLQAHLVTEAPLESGTCGG